ncbi:peptidase M64 [candidate division KSB1 bacterium]|nr:peptidase M64 [candidate division KSB1 bacterium]
MTKYTIIAIILLVSLPLSAYESISFKDHFIDKTMRLDYFHIADAEQEIITLDCIYQQNNWAGNTSQLLYPFNNGLYRAKVFDIASNQLIYSKGFNSYCGEYQTTDPAMTGIKKTFHETILIPYPRNPVFFVLEKRDKNNIYHPLFNQKIDPADIHIVKETPAFRDEIVILQENGDPHHKVDVVILSEGYSREQSKKFRQDCNHFTDALFSVEPYNSQQNKFNIRGLFRPSCEEGVDEPRKHIYKQTVLNASFNALDLERYLLTEDNRTMRDMAAQVPYDAIVIMVNSSRYGGGGIYNFYCISTCDNKKSLKVFLHEFGHSFAGLGDEYYASSVAYNDFYPKGTEPPEPNITALLNPDHVKWHDMLSDGIDIPTDWNKQKYDSLQAERHHIAKMQKEELIRLDKDGASKDEKQKLNEKYKTKYSALADTTDLFLANHPLKHKIGVFEGAGYSSTGLYRPMLQCLMFSNNKMEFCHVCENAIQKMIDYYTR